MHTNKEPAHSQSRSMPNWKPHVHCMDCVNYLLRDRKCHITNLHSPMVDTGMQCCCWRHSAFPANKQEYLTPDAYLTFEICLCNISKHVSQTFLFLITVTFLNVPIKFEMLTFVPYVNSTLRLEGHMSVSAT